MKEIVNKDKGEKLLIRYGIKFLSILLKMELMLMKLLII